MSLIGDIVYREIAGARASVVVATEEAIGDAVEKLLIPPATGSATALAADSTVGSSGAAVSSTATTSTDIDRSDYTTDLDALANSGLWKKYAAATGFPLMAPGWLPEGYRYEDRYPREPGSYDILDGGGNVKGIAMKMVYRLYHGTEKTDQYLGLMETTWLEAPIRSEGREVVYNGVTFTVVGTSQRADHVWWVHDGVLCWVSNTLSYVLSSKDMLKMAQSMLTIPVQ